MYKWLLNQREKITWKKFDFVPTFHLHQIKQVLDMKKMTIFFVVVLLKVFSTLAATDAEYELLRTHLKSRLVNETQENVGHDLGVVQSTVSTFINGSKSPKILRGFKGKYPDEWHKICQPIVPQAVLPIHPIIELSLPIQHDSAAPLKTIVIKAANPKEAELASGYTTELERLVAVVRRLPYAPSKISKKGSGKSPDSFVVIPARGYEDEKSSKGTLFDHVTFQRATGTPTAILIADGQVFDNERFLAHTRDWPVLLKFGKNTNVGKKIPFTSANEENHGLLVIPGRMRDRELDPVRRAHEEKLLQYALRRGQPVLAICAGAWRLWDECCKLVGTSTKGSVREVVDHAAAKMLTLSGTTGKVVYNTQIHAIKVIGGSLLACALKVQNQQLPDCLDVNSVHSKAVNEATLPILLQVSARSTQGKDTICQTKNGTQRKNRHGKEMQPEIDAVEAFESQWGAPLIGVQWHPEGYCDEQESKQLDILRFMTKAGEAYCQKRAMLREMQELHSQNLS